MSHVALKKQHKHKQAIKLFNPLLTQKYQSVQLTARKDGNFTLQESFISHHESRNKGLQRSWCRCLWI